MWPRTLVTLLVAAVALPLACGAAPRVSRSRLHLIQSAFAEYTTGDRYLATGAAESGVILWNARTGERQAQLGQGSYCGSTFALTPDGAKLYGSGSQGLLCAWDVRTRNPVSVGFAEPVRCAGAAIDPSGATLAIAEFASVELWDIRSGSRQRVLKGHRVSWVEGLDFSSDGRFLVSGSEPPPDQENAGEVIVWQVSDGKPVLSIPIPTGAVGFTAGDTRFAALSSGVVTVREVRGGREAWKRAGFDATALSVAAGCDASVVGTKAGAVEVWDARAGRLTSTLRGGDQPILAAAISSDGKHVAAVDAEENVYQWHFE